MPDWRRMALTIDDAIRAVYLLEGSGMPIIGGDVVVPDPYMNYEDNILWRSAFELWGDQYHTLDWSCDVLESPSEQAISESYRFSKEKIWEANNIAKQLGKSCWIVLSVRGLNYNLCIIITVVLDRMEYDYMTNSLLKMYPNLLLRVTTNAYTCGEDVKLHLDADIADEIKKLAEDELLLQFDEHYEHTPEGWILESIIEKLYVDTTWKTDSLKL
jgi:hypothetical protein